MFRERLEGGYRVQAPDEELVVVAARGEKLVVRRPFQTAYLLPVSAQLPLRYRGRRPDVPLQDETVSASGREEIAVPRQGAHSCRVAFERVDSLASCHVPHLDGAPVRPDRHVVAALRPGDGRDAVPLGR